MLQTHRPRTSLFIQINEEDSEPFERAFSESLPRCEPCRKMEHPREDFHKVGSGDSRLCNVTDEGIQEIEDLVPFVDFFGGHSIDKA